MRQIKSNTKFDNNLQAITIIQKLQEKEEKQKEEKQKSEKAMLIKISNKKEKIEKSTSQQSKDIQVNSETSVDLTVESNVEKEIEAEQLKEILDITKDPDLDSLDPDTEKCKVKEVNCSDLQSVDSSITNNSHISNSSILSEITNNTTKSNNTKKSDNTSNSKVTVSDEFLQQLAKENLTDEEITDRVTKHHALQVRKAEYRRDAKLVTFLQNRKTNNLENIDENPSATSVNNKENKNKKQPTENLSQQNYNEKEKVKHHKRSSLRLKELKKKRQADSHIVGSQK